MHHLQKKSKASFEKRNIVITSYQLSICIFSNFLSVCGNNKSSQLRTRKVIRSHNLPQSHLLNQLINIVPQTRPKTHLISIFRQICLDIEIFWLLIQEKNISMHRTKSWRVGWPIARHGSVCRHQILASVCGGL